MARVRLRVKELREKAGLSQREPARRAMVRSATIIEKMEKGRTTRIDLNVLGRIVAALRAEPRHLLALDRTRAKVR